MISKNGVCYDLKDSPYVFTWRGMAFRFSSQTHKDKFVRDVVKREQWLNDSLSRRFKCTVDLPILADIQLYVVVETRGFYIVTEDGAEYESPQSVYVMADLNLLGISHGTI